jgi:predicted DNA-binding ribbon-helix-helix protein
MKSAVKKWSVIINNHKTSVSLEEEFWNAVREIAKAKQVTLSDLLSSIKAEERQSNLSSAIRLFVFQHFRARGQHFIGEAITLRGTQSASIR